MDLDDDLDVGFDADLRNNHQESWNLLCRDPSQVGSSLEVTTDHYHIIFRLIRIGFQIVCWL